VDDLVSRGQPGLAFGEHDTESPVDIFDEHAAEIVRDRRETAHDQALAPRRVMRDDVRWVTCELEKLLNAVARGDELVRVSVTFLELADVRDNLVKA